MTVMWSLMVSLLVGASTQVGVLRNFGTGPDRQTVLRLKSGAEWTLSGEKLEELRRLAGLQVEVQGSEEDVKNCAVFVTMSRPITLKSTVAMPLAGMATFAAPMRHSVNRWDRVLSECQCSKAHLVMVGDCGAMVL